MTPQMTPQIALQMKAQISLLLAMSYLRIYLMNLEPWRSLHRSLERHLMRIGRQLQRAILTRSQYNCQEERKRWESTPPQHDGHCLFGAEGNARWGP